MMAELFKTSLDIVKNDEKECSPKTGNQTYGWNPNLKDGEVIGQGWSRNRKMHGRKVSSMTKFVDDMALTNREWSLF